MNLSSLQRVINPASQPHRIDGLKSFLGTVSHFNGSPYTWNSTSYLYDHLSALLMINLCRLLFQRCIASMNLFETRVFYFLSRVFQRPNLLRLFRLSQVFSVYNLGYKQAFDQVLFICPSSSTSRPSR